MRRRIIQFLFWLLSMFILFVACKSRVYVTTFKIEYFNGDTKTIQFKSSIPSNTFYLYRGELRYDDQPTYESLLSNVRCFYIIKVDTLK